MKNCWSIYVVTQTSRGTLSLVERHYVYKCWNCEMGWEWLSASCVFLSGKKLPLKYNNCTFLVIELFPVFWLILQMLVASKARKCSMRSAVWIGLSGLFVGFFGLFCFSFLKQSYLKPCSLCWFSFLLPLIKPVFEWEKILPVWCIR